MNLKGKLIQITNHYGIGEDFNSKLKSIISKSNDPARLEIFINESLYYSRLSTNPEFRMLMSYSLPNIKIGSYLENNIGSDYYHFIGITSPQDRLRSHINMDELKKLKLSNNVERKY